MVVLLGELIGLIAVVMVLGIPLAWSPIGRALAESIRNRANPSTESFQNLEARVKALESELHQIREALVLGEERPSLGSANQRTLGGSESSAASASADPERARQSEA